ncbi:1,4-alpha-glucan-branching protein [Parapedobacter sp. ISTM3]|uniref:alpha-amylase family glycosyl hydrolase n=1 Tax=Parapedobacter sp. ISTM3 TaxID=2800130 RepID=UPI001905FF53|nr:alpha-amylase family glycosyl hydrolase [Parapedobacter sp. ISTM3]MBK1438667.1 1,4-alpha-glucan-branching protein [Parapedobacter sp. ISTM3]
MKGILFCFLCGLAVLTGCKKPSGNDSPGPDPVVPEAETGLLTFMPAFPTANEEITLRFDSGKGNRELHGYAGDVYAHIGVITSLSGGATDWRYVKTEWGENTAATRLVDIGNGVYELKLKPRVYFGVPTGEKLLKIALVLRSADGSKVGRNSDGSDLYVPLFEQGGLHVRFSGPEMQPLFSPQPSKLVYAPGETIELTALASTSVELAIHVNGNLIGTDRGTTLRATYTFTQSGEHTFTAVATESGKSGEAGFSVLVLGDPEIAELPAGAAPNGVTFMSGGSAAVFALTAPGKTSAYLLGDFNDWSFQPESLMKRTPDGKHWWVAVDGLDPQAAYAYQFVIDGTIRVADPYAELVLDPDHDQYIPGHTYPNLKSYPHGKTSGIVAVTTANEHRYAWRTQGFRRPHPHDLVIYELHVRDFIAARNYKTLVDTLNYLTNLGVNALQLMPVNEFEGNSSWGYNPSFYFAPDKYYGTKNDLKQLIDECHARGIAVILDVVLNHTFGQSPLVRLYAENGRPSADNPWLNTEARHPFNVGYDFNHESEYTKAFVSDVLRFWMEEYRVDGFRFDLSKGFTQKNTGTSESGVAAWSAYDASRVAIWKAYHAFIRSIDADFFVILEHFADDSEESELAAEGMLLWNNLNYPFNEATMGWLDQSDFRRLFHTEHGFSAPNLVSYMESHDEERIMFKNLAYGNRSGGYDVRQLNTALKRVEMAAAFLLAAPGPKMMWQFGELGYDVSIDENGRTGEKPVLWEYNKGPRRELYEAFGRLIGFKTHNEIFRHGTFTYQLAGAVKYISLMHAGQQVVVVGNFDVVPRRADVEEISAGDWYDNMGGQVIRLDEGYARSLAPGEYYVYSKAALASR